MTRPIELVLDMDGVLANLLDAVLSALNRTYSSLRTPVPYMFNEALELDHYEMWRRIHESADTEKLGRSGGEAFLALMKPTPWFADLQRLASILGPARVCVATKLLPFEEFNAFCLKGKTRWLREHAAGVPWFAVAYSESKSDRFCHGAHSVLVEDCPAAHDEWKRAGGTSFLVRWPYNSEHPDAMNFDQILAKLTNLCLEATPAVISD